MIEPLDRPPLLGVTRVRSNSRSSQTLATTPVAHDGDCGHAQRFCGFVDAQSAEVAQFHDLALTFVECGQRIECIVERNHVEGGLAGDDQRFVQRHLNDVAATFAFLPRARNVHQDPSHQLCRNGEEMGAVLPLARGSNRSVEGRPR